MPHEYWYWSVSGMKAVVRTSAAAGQESPFWHLNNKTVTFLVSTLCVCVCMCFLTSIITMHLLIGATSKQFKRVALRT